MLIIREPFYLAFFAPLPQKKYHAKAQKNAKLIEAISAIILNSLSAFNFSEKKCFKVFLSCAIIFAYGQSIRIYFDCRRGL